VASSTASGVDLGCHCTNTPGPVIAGPVIALSPPTPHRGRVTVQWWTRAEGGQFSGADRGSVFTCRWQAQAVQLLLDALETGSDIFDDLDQIRSLHPRNNTFPGEVFMGLAARALASRHARIPDVSSCYRHRHSRTWKSRPAGFRLSLYDSYMLRPASWTKPAGASPARVIAGEPGSRPRSAIERSRAERGVKSLFGGSKRAGRRATRPESCSLVKSTTGEPSRSCHGEGPRPTNWPAPEMPLVGSLRGTGSGTYARFRHGTGGSTTRACTSSWAPSATRRRRNHVQKTVGKPCAGEPHARIERGMGKRAGSTGSAPLTTNGPARRKSGPGSPRRGHRRGPALGQTCLRHTARTSSGGDRRRRCLRPDRGCSRRSNRSTGAPGRSR